MISSFRQRARRAWPALAAALSLASGIAAAPTVLGAQDSTARPGVRIGLTYNTGTRPGIAVLPIAGVYGDSVRAIVERDLDYGDRVTIVSGTAAAAASPPGAAAPNYALLAQLGAAGVVRITLTAAGAHVVLYDVAGARIAGVTDLPLPAPALSPAWRLAVHDVADEVGLWVAGARGSAATRILFVRDGRIFTVDSDGAGERALTDRVSALSPTWHPRGQSFAYTMFGARGSQVMVRDIAGGGARTLAAAAGLNITPAYSPDGATVAYAFGAEAGTDLFVVPAGGGSARRVTVGRGTDNVSPSFSPDGRRIAFTSGRSGHPEVYITDADGTSAELLTAYTFGERSYRSNPDWSPDNRAVAFQSQLGGRFQVMVINLRDRGMRQLTTDGSNEDPSWAPDGRHLVFSSTRGGVRQLYVLDVESGRTRQLTRGAAARLPAWSPRLGRR